MVQSCCNPAIRAIIDMSMPDYLTWLKQRAITQSLAFDHITARCQQDACRKQKHQG